MQTKPNIKWRNIDSKNLAKRVRAFNAKRTRLIKQVPELADILPAKVTVQELKANITTRSDFNKTIARLNRFMVKGAESTVTTKQGVVTTKYQIRELQINKAIINRRRAIMRKNENISLERGTTGSINKTNLRPKKLNVDAIGKSLWKEVVHNFEAQAMDTYYRKQDEKYKKNYLKAVKDAYGDNAPILEKLEQLPGEVIADMFYYDPNLQIDFHYPIDEEDAAENYVFFEETFKDYLKTQQRGIYEKIYS